MAKENLSRNRKFPTGKEIQNLNTKWASLNSTYDRDGKNIFNSSKANKTLSASQADRISKSDIYKSILRSSDKDYEDSIRSTHKKEIVVDNKGISKSALSGNHTITDQDEVQDSSFSVRQSSSDSYREYNNRLIDTNRLTIKGQTKALSATMVKLQSRSEALQLKFGKAQLQMSQGLLSQANKANEFRYSVQATYYKNSIEYKKNILTEIQETNRLLKLGFNIVNDKKDESREVESFARVMLGEDWKKGLKGGFLRAFNKLIAGSVFDLSTMDLMKQMAGTMIDQIKEKGVLASIGGIAAKGAMKTTLGSRNAASIELLLNDPGKFMEIISNRMATSKNPFIAALGYGFGGKADGLATFDMKEYYNRGKANDRATFDKAVHTSITQIIPQYLAKMTQALTKEKEAKYYDFNTKRYVTLSDTINDLKSKNKTKSHSKEMDRKGRELLAAIRNYDSPDDAVGLFNVLKKIINDDKKANVFLRIIISVFKILASNGYTVQDYGLIMPYTGNEIKRIIGKNIDNATAEIVAVFFNEMMNYEDEDIKGAWDALLAEADSYRDSYNAQITELKNKLDYDTATNVLFAGGANEKAIKNKDYQKMIKELNSGKSKDSLSQDTINAIVFSSDNELDADFKFLEANGIEMSDSDKLDLARFLYTGRTMKLPIKIANDRIRGWDRKLQDLANRGEEDSIMYKSIKALRDKTKELVQDANDTHNDEINIDDIRKFEREGFNGANRFGGAKIPTLDAKSIKENADLFLNSDLGNTISRGAQAVSIMGLSTIMARKAGMGPWMAPIAGAIVAGAAHASGKVNAMVRTIGTDAGDQKMDDGRTKRQALMENLVKDMLPAGFATATGIKVSQFVKNNLRFGSILGPIMGFGIGSGVFALSRIGWIGKIVKLFLKPLSFLGKGIDKMLFKGAIGKVVNKAGETITNSAIGKMLNLGNKKKYSYKEILSDTDREATNDYKNQKSEAIKSTLQEMYPDAFTEDGKLKDGYYIKGSSLYGPDDKEIGNVSDKDETANAEAKKNKKAKKEPKNLNEMKLEDVEALQKEIDSDPNSYNEYAKRHIKKRLEELRKNKDDKAGSLSGGITIPGTKAGTCAPAVMAKLMNIWYKNSDTLKDYNDLARPYIGDSKTGIRMDFFRDKLSDIKVTILSHKAPSSNLLELKKEYGSDYAVIGHLSKDNGHFVLFYNIDGSEMMCYDPLKGKPFKISIERAVMLCDAVTIVKKGKIGFKGFIKNKISNAVNKITDPTRKLTSSIMGASSGVLSSINPLSPMSDAIQGVRNNSSPLGNMLHSTSKKSPAIDVNIVGGHLDAVGIVGAIDAEAYRNKMTMMARGIGDTSKRMKNIASKVKDFFLKDPEAKKELLDQDRQEELEGRNAENLEKIANRNNEGKEEKKKGGLLSKLGQFLPTIMGGLFALFKLGPRGIITKIAEALIKGGKKIFSFIKGTFGIVQKIGSFFGLGGKKGAQELAEEGLEAGAKKIVGETAQEVAEEAVEAGVKGAAGGVKNASKLGKVLSAIRKYAEPLINIVHKIPIVGPLIKKVGEKGSRLINGAMEILEKFGKKAAEEGMENATKAGAKTGAKSIQGGIKGTLSNFIGIGTLVNIGFAMWAIASAIRDIPKTFGIEPTEVTWKHRIATGVLVCVLEVIESTVPMAGWVMIPLRILFESQMIREFYKLLYKDDGTNTEDEDRAVKLEGDEVEYADDGRPIKKKNKNQAAPPNGETAEESSELDDKSKDGKKRFLEKQNAENAIFGGSYGGFVDGNGNMINISDGSTTGSVLSSLMGGKGSGTYNVAKGGNSGNVSTFYNQNTFMGGLNIGSDTTKDSGCALAVAKMITKFLGNPIKDMDLYNGLKNYVLKDNSVAMTYFTRFLNGNPTRSMEDIKGALSSKGGAVVLLIRKGQGYHYICIINNGKLLYGDPENSDWVQISINGIPNFVEACTFGSFIPTRLATSINQKIGGKGPGKTTTIGFGTHTLDKMTANYNYNRKESESKKGAFGNYNESLFEYHPPTGGENIADTGNVGSIGANTPLGKILSAVSMGEHDNGNLLSTVGKVSHDTYKGNDQYAFGPFGIDSKAGNSYWDWHKLGYNQKAGGDLAKFGDNPRSKEYRDAWAKLGQTDPQKFLDLQMDFYMRHYYKMQPNDIAGQLIGKGMNPNVAKSLGMQYYYLDLMTQRGPQGGPSDFKNSGALTSSSPQDALSKIQTYEKNHMGKRSDRRVRMRGQYASEWLNTAGGAPSREVRKDDIVTTRYVSTRQPFFKDYQACGIASAMTLHKIFFGDSKDVKPFGDVANKFRRKDNGFVREEFFTKFGGTIARCTGKEMLNILSKNYKDGAVVFLKANHWVLATYRGNVIQYIDTYGYAGIQPILESLNMTSKMMSEIQGLSIMSCIFFAANKFKTIEQAQKASGIINKTGVGLNDDTVAAGPLDRTAANEIIAQNETNAQFGSDNSNTNNGSVSLKGGLIGGFFDSKGNHIDISGMITKYHEKMQAYYDAKRGIVRNTINPNSVPLQGSAEAQRWMTIARGEIGVTEKGNRNRVLEYLRMAGINGMAHWCAAFLSWCLVKAGVLDRGFASSQYPLNEGKDKFYKIDNPVYGAIGVWSRNSGRGGDFTGGHISFYVRNADKAGDAICLGGNQSDSVKESSYTMSKSDNLTFRGWYLPKGVKNSVNPGNDIGNIGNQAGEYTKNPVSKGFEGKIEGDPVGINTITSSLFNTNKGNATYDASEKIIANSKLNRPYKVGPITSSKDNSSISGNPTIDFKEMNNNIAFLANAAKEQNEIAKRQLDAQMMTADSTEKLSKKDFGGNTFNTLKSSNEPTNNNEFSDLRNTLQGWIKESAIDAKKLN